MGISKAMSKLFGFVVVSLEAGVLNDVMEGTIVSDERLQCCCFSASGPLLQSRRGFKDGPEGRNGMVADYMKGQWMVKFLESKRVHVKAQSYGTFPT